MTDFVPAYRKLGPDRLQARADAAVATLEDCHGCPRECGVNRLRDRWSACKTGRHAVVSSHFPHFGEEDCLRGRNGSGTIFFAHCNLRCVFCQNWSISQGIEPGEVGEGPAPTGATADEIADMALELQRKGCHNLNLVTPEHVVPQVIEALAVAAGRGLELPVVYNTSAYDAPESLELLEGIVDVYMPDLKFLGADRSATYLRARDYPDAAQAAVVEMHRQVGDLETDGRGLARRGVLLRHLVMPGMLDETRAILEWVVDTLGPDTYVNLMDQYRPAARVGSGRYEAIDRRLRGDEFREARRMARELGLRRLDERGSRPAPAGR